MGLVPAPVGTSKGGVNSGHARSICILVAVQMTGIHTELSLIVGVALFTHSHDIRETISPHRLHTTAGTPSKRTHVYFCIDSCVHLETGEPISPSPKRPVVSRLAPMN
jgi:hypothetical protein